MRNPNASPTGNTFGLSRFGPSGATRTRGLDIPNVACYQLHYTRIFACHDYSTKLVQIKVFPVCSHLCGQSGFSAWFCCPGKSRKRPCCKGFRTLAVPIVDTRRIAPKAGALPMMNMGQEIPNPYYFNDLCRKVKNFPRHVSRSRCRITIHLGQENKKDEG